MNKKPEILSDETKQSFEDAIMTPEEIEEDILAFEKQYGFSSEKLLEMQAEGTLPDSFDMHLWSSLLQYRP
jgi:hypothetical protein